MAGFILRRRSVIKKTTALLMAALGVSFPAFAVGLTEEQCKSQAATSLDLLDMIDKGMPADSGKRDKIEKAVSLYKSGEYCAAREIILTLGDQR